MSLDFYLIDPNPVTERCECSRCGHAHTSTSTEEVFRANVTHNLGRMAEAAGIYGCLWRPEECDPPIVTAAQCIPILEGGLARLRKDRTTFVAYNDSNGWGTYQQFIPWIERVLAACREHPQALVRASR
jgi:hypothetical protein